MDVYSLWSRRRSRRGGNKYTELTVKQEKGETNQDEQSAGLVYWDLLAGFVAPPMDARWFGQTYRLSLPTFQFGRMELINPTK